MPIRARLFLGSHNALICPSRQTPPARLPPPATRNKESSGPETPTLSYPDLDRCKETGFRTARDKRALRPAQPRPPHKHPPPPPSPALHLPGQSHAATRRILQKLLAPAPLPVS